MKNKKDIPLFIVEEHHEAFIVWKYAIHAGLIPSKGNCLFHVDEHSDMGVPRFNSSVKNIQADISSVKRFTYKELNIGTFILPACYLEIFNEVFWIKRKHLYSNKSHRRFVRSYNQIGKRLLSGKAESCKNIIDSDKKEFDYFLSTVEQLPTDREVILDIDLDYFSCTGNPIEKREIIIEITKKEYDFFRKNPYHSLRYVGVYNIEAIHEDNKYYYMINHFEEQYPNELKVEKKVIIQRLERFIDCLSSKKVKPLIVDVCRSRFSGYTPIDQWNFIESELLIRLNMIFNLKKARWN